MSSHKNLKATLNFLRDLRENNNKPWFDSHRETYEQARDAFESLVEDLISEVSSFQDLKGIIARDCIFRINRDIRFSRDKRPYKWHMSAEIAPGGRRSGNLGYYIHISPDDESLIAGGLYTPTTAQLTRFREAIARDVGPLRQVTRDRKFTRYFGSIEGDRLRTAPQGYSREHPEIDLLRLKQVMVVHRLTDKQVLARNLPTRAVQVMKAIKPFNEYLNHVLQ
jgi:uncharacterized protein (TIGR02453 family)